MVEICLENHENSQIWLKFDRSNKTEKSKFKINCCSLVQSIRNRSKCFKHNVLHFYASISFFNKRIKISNTIDHFLPSSITSNALTNSFSHLQTRIIWKRQVSKREFEKYELQDTMGILTQNCQYTKYTYNLSLWQFWGKTL